MRRSGADGVLCPDLQIGVLGPLGCWLREHAQQAKDGAAGRTLWLGGVHDIHQGFEKLVIVVICSLSSIILKFHRG